jgi:hypothetical protein
MSETVLSYFSRLTPDTWRKASGFSDDIETRHRELFGDQRTESQLAEILGEWIQTKQTCLFGRAAAKLDALTYCVLTESDVHQSDEAIREKIQASRLQWTREAFEGKKSGFIIWLVSPKIALAEPNFEMMGVARRVCELYLDHEIEADRIYLDEVFLEKPGQRRTTWKWNAGVNYFCSQGDKRWWHDHRFPGGMAFSVNSVGHLVKSSIIAKGMNELGEMLGAPAEGYPDLPIDSLERALQVAMHTISLASDTVSGKATELLPLPNDLSNMTGKECPAKLPRPLAGKNFCEYKGYYHTDFTLPSEYFRNSIERPAEIESYSLDFTYLFRRGLDNPDFISMGEGRQVRAVPGKEDEESPSSDSETWSNPKELVANETVVSIEDEGRLSAALSAGRH